MMTTRNLLITGTPGVGKSTLMRKIAGSLRDLRLRGFITDEIRKEGRREGFRLETFQGQRTILAHLGLKSPHRVGRYRIDLPALDRVVRTSLVLREDVDLYLVDEIGKMECLSKSFVAAMERLLDSRRSLIATIAAGSHGFMGEVKRREDVEIWELTFGNRDGMPTRVLQWLESGLPQG